MKARKKIVLVVMLAALGFSAAMPSNTRGAASCESDCEDRAQTYYVQCYHDTGDNVGCMETADNIECGCRINKCHVSCVLN